MRHLAILAVLMLFCACDRAPEPVFSEGPRRIIVISLDTLGAKHLECYGYERETAPHITAVADAGVRFSHATAPSNWTLPSHVSLFTGLYPARHGVRSKDQVLGEAPAHLVDALRSAGFSTAAFTGGAYLAPAYGLDRGFDHYESEEEWEHRTDDTLAKARAWLSDHRDDDVFLFLHTYEIHAPYTAPPHFARQFMHERRSKFRGQIVQLQAMKEKTNLRPRDIQTVVDLYDAGIAYTDGMLGEFLEWLATEGLDENTLLVIGSDHGEEFWEHGDHSHGGDMLGNEVTRVPLIVRLPGDGNPGAVIEREVSFMDIMPTVLDAAGVPRPANLDGFSLMPELAGWPDDPDEHEARRRRRFDGANRSQGVGLCEGEHFVAAENGVWKAVAPHPDAADTTHRIWPAMIDLEADPAETSPLACEGTVWERLVASVDRLVGSGRREDHKPATSSGVDEATRRQLEALGY